MDMRGLRFYQVKIEANQWWNFVVFNEVFKFLSNDHLILGVETLYYLFNITAN